MKNVPTWADIQYFLKKHAKLILAVTGIVFLMFAIFSAYSIYSSQRVEEAIETQEESDLLTTEEIEEIMQRGPDDITQVEMENIEKSLLKDAYYFRVYIESETDADWFNSPETLEGLLLSDGILSRVEEQTGYSLKPSPQLALSIRASNDNAVQHIIIGTGNPEANEALAREFYNVFQQRMMPFLENKNVFVLDAEPMRYELTQTEVAATAEDFSVVQLVVTGMASIIGGLMLGIIIALGKEIFSSEISSLYALAENEEDKVIDFTQLRHLSSEALAEKVSHAISYPSDKNKLVLSQVPLEQLTLGTARGHVGSLETDTMISFAEDVSKSANNQLFNEVILLIQKEHTTKDWYQEQRVQLNNYHADVKIIVV